MPYYLISRYSDYGLCYQAFFAACADGPRQTPGNSFSGVIFAMQINNFEKAYSEAFELARRQLLDRDLATCCESAGAVLIAQTAQSATVELQYLNASVRLVLPACSCTTAGGVELHVWDKILLLHYLLNAKPQTAKSREVGFKDITSAALYFNLFENRCLKPLAKAFGAAPEYLFERGGSLGGIRTEAGDCSISVRVLPRVAITIIVWKADDEFPASAHILFDSSIEQCFSAEDVVVLCQRIVLQLLGKW